MRFVASLLAASAALVAAAPAEAAFLVIKGYGTGSYVYTPAPPFGQLPQPNPARDADISFTIVLREGQLGSVFRLDADGIAYQYGQLNNFWTPSYLRFDGMTVPGSQPFNMGFGRAVGNVAYSTNNRSGPQESFVGSISLTSERLLTYDGVLDFQGVTISVPEPTTWAMMIAGFGIVGASLRRRVRSAGLA